MAAKRSYTKRSYKADEVVEAPVRFTPPGGWNKEFEAIFHEAVHGKGNLAIEAVAGGGKTTALVEAVIRLCEKPGVTPRILLVAFNVSVKDELKKRLTGYPVDIMTCHGLGHRSVMANWRTNNFDLKGSICPFMLDLAANEIGDEKEKQDDREALCQLIGMAMTCLAGTVDEVAELISKYGIETSYTANDFAARAKKIMAYLAEKPRTIQIKGFGKFAGKVFSKTALTFDQQCWLPVVNNWKIDGYDIVLVDEAQDLSPVRRELIRKAMKPKGRLFVVGDRYQAIYSFAGADIDSLPMLIEEFDCKVLPLSCSFRCDEAIIAEAQQFNPNIVARKNASEGTVDRIEAKDLLASLKPGVVLLSRTNAPLIRCFFQLARAQRKVKFIGRDYGAIFAKRIKAWRQKHEALVAKGQESGYFTGRKLLEYNDEWLQKVAADRRKTDDPEDDSGLTDRHRDEHASVEALTIALDSRLDSTDAVQEVLDRCFAFSPDEAKNEASSESFITLSSVHRFKGLERHRAYVLTSTMRPDKGQEEVNIFYVAVTRAKEHLTYVDGEIPKTSSEEED